MLTKTDVPDDTATSAFSASRELDEGVPMSVKIRERLVAAKKRFNANDNIADFLQPGDMDALLDEVEV